MPIYKYVSSDRIDILQNSQIRFTQPGAFNDPFESFPYFKSIATESFINDLVNNYEYDEREVEKMLEESFKKEMGKYPGVNIPFDLVKDTMKGGMKQWM